MIKKNQKFPSCNLIKPQYISLMLQGSPCIDHFWNFVVEGHRRCGPCETCEVIQDDLVEYTAWVGSGQSTIEDCYQVYLSSPCYQVNLSGPCYQVNLSSLC